MKYALTDTNGIVQNIIAYDPESDYEPPEGLTVAEVNDWITIGDPATAPEPAPELPTRQGLIEVLASCRYAKQNSVAMIDEELYRTDPESRQALSDCLIATILNPAFTVDYKMADGTWKTLDKAGITNVWVKGAAFIQKCFASEKIVKTNIANYTTEGQVIAAFNQAMAIQD